ncbi:hypothetical protein MHLP_00035 [Candidatus Mycoplasma haematolamae str. Purdue]|uniref:Uncharacterized protein n=1 Tax=Mycoplasma haematolamae (strain Purdue) TaxID=1212765 RepID=I7C525_MYCHA|nr:hypothetical protein [Candidatus Mycoplasma haematolamae]AFO51587.1 hypothetical protein MHLP_00035 [Candidatus Mycoplasma haematolamae str. Purdue]
MNKFIKKYLEAYIGICKTLLMGKAIVIETDTLIALAALNRKVLYQLKNRPLKKTYHFYRQYRSVSCTHTWRS